MGEKNQTDSSTTETTASSETNGNDNGTPTSDQPPAESVPSETTATTTNEAAPATTDSNINTAVDTISEGVDQVQLEAREPDATQAQENNNPSAENEESVFSGWGFGNPVVNPNMSSISNLFSSTGDSVGNLLNAPSSFFSSSSAPTSSTPANDETETTEQHGDVEGEDLGKAASHLANAAGAELENASKAAQETIGKAAQELGRGWGTLNSFLDDMLSPDDQQNGSSNNRSASSSSNAHGGGISDIASELGASSSATDIQQIFIELFPHLSAKADEEQEQVVDHYKCTLVQKYRCYLNNSTPEKAFALRGRLFVTMSNIAMYVADDAGAFGGNAFGINIPFESVTKIQKGAKQMLRVVTRAQTSFIFAEFESETHFQGALSLLEQLGAASSVPPQPTPQATNAGSGAPSPEKAPEQQPA